MSNEISKKNTSQDSVLKNNIFQNENSENEIISVQDDQREFYEEFVQRKKYERHEIITKKFYQAKKRQKQYQKKINQILKVNIKTATGPRWFQELSDKQLSILHSFSEHIKEDYDLNTSKNTRRTLKALGVMTFIPHTVAMDALFASELNTVSYLTAIKNYLTHKDKTNCDLTNKKKHDKKNEYSLEVRILMSSILNLAFPNLILKLNYCLSEPKPNQTLELPKIKSKRKPPNYYSPYLELLPESSILWSEAEKTHNNKVKKQKLNENMKYKKKQLRENELKKMKNTGSKMKIKYHDHQLENIFYNQPIEKDFDHSKILPKKNNIHTIKSHINEKTAVGDTNNVGNESMFPTQLSHLKLTEEIIDKEETAVDKPQSSSVTFQIVGEKVNDRKPIIRSSQLSVFSSSHDPMSDIDDPKKPYGWLKTDSKAPSISLGPSYVSLMNGVSEEDVNKTLVVLDLDSSVSNYNGQYDCNRIIAKNDENVNLLVENSAQVNNNEKDVDGGMSLGILQMLQFSEMDEAEMNVLQDFRKHGYCMGKAGACSRRKFHVDADADVTEELLKISTNNKESETPSPRQNGHERQKWSDDRELKDSSNSKVGHNFKTISVELKMSLANVLPVDDENAMVTELSSTSLKHDRDEFTTEPPSMNNSEDESVDLDCVLSVLRQLPAFKQLQAVLNLLSVLGDPIAGYPELIELNQLRRWYERRLKINEPITSKMKKGLMKKSLVTWNIPTTDLTDVYIPQNPFQLKNNTEKVTWDHINYMKHTIKKTKTNYTVNLKHVAIDNARKMYSSMGNNYKLRRNFKQTFFDYFPTKENDCFF